LSNFSTGDPFTQPRNLSGGAGSPRFKRGSCGSCAWTLINTQHGGSSRQNTDRIIIRLVFMQKGLYSEQQDRQLGSCRTRQPICRLA
jgi:hypothetical protein